MQILLIMLIVIFSDFSFICCKFKLRFIFITNTTVILISSWKLAKRHTLLYRCNLW